MYDCIDSISYSFCWCQALGKVVWEFHGAVLTSTFGPSRWGAFSVEPGGYPKKRGETTRNHTDKHRRTAETHSTLAGLVAGQWPLLLLWLLESEKRRTWKLLKMHAIETWWNNIPISVHTPPGPTWHISCPGSAPPFDTAAACSRSVHLRSTNSQQPTAPKPECLSSWPLHMSKSPNTVHVACSRKSAKIDWRHANANPRRWSQNCDCL